MSFGRGIKSLWAHLPGVYARGSKRSYTGECRRELSCLTFDQGFTAPPAYKTPISHQNVQITSNNCVYGQCAHFTGGQSKLSIPPPILMGKKRYSLSFWYRFDGSSFHSGLVSGGPCPNPHFKILTLLANQVSVDFVGKHLGDFVGKSGWNHIVVSWGGRYARLYANGVPRGRVRVRKAQSGCPIYFAAAPYGSGRIGPFSGYVDQICFYNIGLRYRDVQLLYRNPCISYLVTR
ncbi:hypothetical protein LSAT2_008114 [Lamellibrachia satsuma]|nr:hypothetical protein LSAT2_008114 [Lamellibrachia satsuma]